MPLWWHALLLFMLAWELFLWTVSAVTGMPICLSFSESESPKIKVSLPDTNKPTHTCTQTHTDKCMHTYTTHINHMHAHTRIGMCTHTRYPHTQVHVHKHHTHAHTPHMHTHCSPLGSSDGGNTVSWRLGLRVLER